MRPLLIRHCIFRKPQHLLSQECRAAFRHDGGTEARYLVSVNGSLYSTAFPTIKLLPLRAAPFQAPQLKLYVLELSAEALTRSHLKYPEQHIQHTTYKVAPRHLADLRAGFVLGGSGAGAQAAAVVASEAGASEWGDSRVTGLRLCIPAWLVPEIVLARYREIYTSHTQSAGPTTPEMLQLARDLAQVDVWSKLFSPFDSARGVEGLPQAYVQVGDADPLWDDGLIFVRAVGDAGGEVKWNWYEALEHDSLTIWWDERREPRSLIEDSMEGMGWLLERGG